MRRMIDPKEIGGGGSTAPAMHAYRINNNNNYWYIVYSTKDYNFEIGKLTFIEDFDRNDNYKELRSSGVYPANGFVNLSSPEGAYLSVMQVKIDASSPYRYLIQGRQSDNGNFSSTYAQTLISPQIVKLF